MEGFKNPKMIAGVAGLFVTSFALFLYLSFPYGVLKEAISAQIQLATGITVRIESFGPTIPLGFYADGVEIYKGQSPKLHLKSVTAKLSILQIFLARIGVSIDIEDQKSGEMALGIGFGVFDLIAGNGGLPSVVSFQSKSFSIDSVTAFGIQAAVDSGVGGPLAGPLLAKLAFKGKISGKVDLKINGKVPSQSSGDIKINLVDAILVLSDPSLNFPDQKFKTAQVSVVMNGGSIVVDPSTRLTATELDMGVDGKIALRPTFSNSDLSLKAFVKLEGSLGRDYGYIIDGLSSGMGKNGSIQLQIAGTVATPQVNPI